MLRDVSLMPDVVTVVIRERQTTPTGHTKLSEVRRVELRCRLQESTTDDITALAAAGETAVLHMRRLYCQHFPGDDISQVVESSGRVWNVVGEPKRHRQARGTSRDVVMLRAAGAERAA